MVMLAAAKAIETLRSLPLGQKEAFASSFANSSAKLTERQGVLLAQHANLPPELPDPLP